MSATDGHQLRLVTSDDGRGKPSSEDPNSGPTPVDLPGGHVLNRLLELGAERPVARAGLVPELWQRLEEGTAPLVAQLPDTRLRLSKSSLLAWLRCPAQAAVPPRRERPSVPMIAGTITHRAIQSMNTHQGLCVDEYVTAAIDRVRAERRDVDELLYDLSVVELSDLTSRVSGQVEAWRHDWPRLDPRWRPQWELSLGVEIGGLRLVGRPDLCIGSPRATGLQTMAVIDLKAGLLNESHNVEAEYHALLMALRWGVPPFVSVCYSAATGSWTTPARVDEDMLWRAVGHVTAAVTGMVETSIGTRPVQFNPGPWCGWCPLAASCDARQQAEGA